MRQTSQLLDDVVARFDDPKPNGTGIMVRCPGHEDRKQSLHVSIGDDGRIVLFCHAGCETKDILALRGMKFEDLWPSKTNPRAATPRKLLSTTAYDYGDEIRKLLFQVVRKQFADGKTFTQRKPKPGGGWEYTVVGVRMVLFQLADIVESGLDTPVLLVAGEKDALRAKREGRLATTNPGGEGKWRPEYGESLRGRVAPLIPDNDQPGFKHALTVHRALADISERTPIILLEVQPKGDLSDWLDAGGKIADLDRIILQGETSIPGARLIEVDELARLAGEDAANSAYQHMCGDDALETQDFPVDVFPDSIANYIREGADAIGVPADMIAMPLLGFAAGVIGNTCAVALKPGWLERPNLWTAIIGEPGCGKSPAVDYARGPIDAMQAAAWTVYQERMVEWEREVAAAKADKRNKDPLLDKPVLDHYFTTDATTEALAGILSSSPGVTVTRDELVGWVRSFDAYRQAGDRQSFLSLWAGAPLKVDRKGTGTIFVPHPCVPIVGGIQPEMLSDLGEEASRRDGFVERILMVWPVAKAQRWTDVSPSSGTRWEVDRIFAKLRMNVVAGETGPVLHLTDEARRTFANWFNQNREIIESSTGVAAGCYAKYPGQLARIALVLHCLNHPGDRGRKIETETIVNAISLIEYLRGHLRKILPTFASVGSEKTAGLLPRIMRVLTRHDGEWVARVELRKGLGNSVPSEEINTALDVLWTEGKVENRTVPTGSRPREESRATGRTNAHMHHSTETGKPEKSPAEARTNADMQDSPGTEKSESKSAYLHKYDGDNEEVTV